MKKILHFFTSKIKYIVIIYFILQAILVFTIHPNYKSDALYYYKLAQECISNNEFYPAKEQINEDYIVAPLYINAIVIFLKVYNSTITISLFNLLIILLQLLILYKITLKIFSDNIGRISVLLYLFYINTVGLMLQNNTELFFLLLISSSLYFYLINKNLHYILSGILLGCAIAVRPAAWALLIAFMILQVIEFNRTKRFSLRPFYLYSGVLFFILYFGFWTNSYFGKFEFTSSTGPVNLLLGANDDATGGFNSTVFEKGKAGYIANPDSMTFVQKGDFYQDVALNWMTEHPIKWLALAPLKFFHTFGWDDIALSSLLNFDNTNFLKVLRILIVEKNFDKALPGTSASTKFLYFFVLIFCHLIYYLILISIVLGITLLIRNKQNNVGTLLIILFSLFSILMIMITVGTPRYKYPIFILMLPFAAYYIEMKFGSGKQNIEKL
jgi:4-amino-4-deoxy-L-arabinose transferase-like glycosyltransferase